MSLGKTSGVAVANTRDADVGARLIGLGYVAVPMRDNGAGHLYACATIGERVVDMLIDTGASNSVIDAMLAKELGLRITPSPLAGAGVGDSRIAADPVESPDFCVGGIAVDEKVYAMDLSALGAALRQRGAEPPSVVLGGDVMRALHAVLLYRENLLYLLPKH